MFGRSPNSNQAKICVLRFSANRVWLVSRFYIFSFRRSIYLSDTMVDTADTVDMVDAYFTSTPLVTVWLITESD